MYCQFYAVGFSVPSPVTAFSRSIAGSRNLRHSRVRSFVQEEVRQNTAARTRRRRWLYTPRWSVKTNHMWEAKFWWDATASARATGNLKLFRLDQYVLDHESGLLCCIFNQFSLKKPADIIKNFTKFDGRRIVKKKKKESYKLKTSWRL